MCSNPPGALLNTLVSLEFEDGHSHTTCEHISSSTKQSCQTSLRNLEPEWQRTYHYSHCKLEDNTSSGNKKSLAEPTETKTQMKTDVF